jgi:hypothetical protein
MDWRNWLQILHVESIVGPISLPLVRVGPFVAELWGVGKSSQTLDFEAW